MNAIEGTAKQRAAGNGGQLIARGGRPGLQRQRHALAVRAKQGLHFFRIRHDQLGGFARRQGANVGNQIGQRDVDFMSHRRNDRNARSGDGPQDDLFVECPQIFQAAAAASDDEHVDFAGEAVDRLDARGDFFRRAVTLHAARHDQHMHVSPAAAQHFQKIVNCRAGWAGDESDPLGEAGQRLFSIFVEQPFGGQFFAKFAQRQFERPDALGVHLANHELIAAPRRVQIEPALADHLHAVFRFESQPPGRRAPNDRPQLGLFVLERQITMPGPGPREVRDFARHPNRGERAFDQTFDLGGQVRDRKDRLVGGKIVVGHGYRTNRGRA